MGGSKGSTRTAMAGPARWLKMMMLLAVSGTAVYCQDTEKADATASTEEESDDDLDSSPDADTVVLFSEYPDQKIPVGKDIQLLVGLTNSGSRKFNVTRVWGSLHSALGYHFLIQNFTVSEPFAIIEADQQGTLAYTCKPTANLEPREFVLTLNMRYEDEDGTKYHSNLFNSTITIVEATGFDFKEIFPVLASGAVICLVLQLILRPLLFSKKKKSSSNKSAVEDDEPLSAWLPQQASNGRPGAKKRKAK